MGNRRRDGRSVIKIRMDWALLAVPFGILLALGIGRIALGPGQAMLPLLAVAPAAAAALGGVLYTVIVGLLAFAEQWLFSGSLPPASSAQQIRNALILTVAVTVGGALASYARHLQERELLEVRAVADAAQRVVLRPLPERFGSVQLSARYLSATSRALVGGDLYAVVPAAGGIRLIIGDAEGKGLPAVQQAAAAMCAFRMAAYEESSLSGVAERIETSLLREFGAEQFITAILAEMNADGREMVLLNCGHPRPLRLGSGGPTLLGPEENGLPLGLGPLTGAQRVAFAIPWEAGEPVLFYTDGLTEARDRAGRFFPLTSCASVRGDPDPATFIERLIAEVSRYTGGRSGDDMALLLAWRSGGSGRASR